MSARWPAGQSPALIDAVNAFRALTPYDQALLATYAFSAVTNRALYTAALHSRTPAPQELSHA